MTTTDPSTDRATPRISHTVMVHTYNTLELTAGDVYHLVTPYAGPYAPLAGEASAVYVNVLNLGPGNVYIRADDDPADGDPQSETLPPGHADNLILVPDGPQGLRFLAMGALTTITIRLVQG